MTLHKIDREKLAYELAARTSNDMGDYWRINVKKPFTSTLDPVQIIQAAQNWLTITDPGFEADKKMTDAAHPWLSQWHYMNAGTKMDALRQAFKAMIAKAGEP